MKPTETSLIERERTDNVPVIEEAQVVKPKRDSFKETKTEIPDSNKMQSNCETAENKVQTTSPPTESNESNASHDQRDEVKVGSPSSESSPIECIPPVRPERTKRSSRIQVPEWTPPKNDLFSYLFSCVKPRVAD